MSSLRAIPRSEQHVEPWANGAGSTRVMLREPDDTNWCLRVSVAQVDHDGPFSELRDTQRILVPLDAAMTLCFPDGETLHATRMHALHFEGAPAPTSQLPEGPTRDFNLMLRHGCRGEVFPRTLVDSMLLAPTPGTRWLVYLDSGHAEIQIADEPALELAPGDAALVANNAAARSLVKGAGEIILVKLYA